MKKELYSKFACFQGLTSNVNPDTAIPEFVPDESELMRVINEIFAVDERTGQPLGDITYYLSPNGNPTIKAWLENNLLKPRFDLGQHNENITDDMLVEFSRGADESVDSYAERMAGYRDTAIAEYEKSLEYKEE